MRVLAVALIAAALAGCAAPPATVDRHAKLLSLAADEAGRVTDPQSRLRRQLNLADRQLDDDRTNDARQTLAAAGQTLRETPPAALPPRIRIAGWVSISELSRRAEDTATADGACDQGVATTRGLTPTTERAEYAVGVATEVRELHGKPAAAALLVESAGWAKPIPSTNRRREAMAEIAGAIFDCDDYPAGVAVVRSDPDPAWRSDTLMLLAGSSRQDWESQVGNGAVPGSTSGVIQNSVTDSQSFEGGLNSPRSPFSQSVDYRSVFKTP